MRQLYNHELDDALIPDLGPRKWGRIGTVTFNGSILLPACLLESPNRKRPGRRESQFPEFQKRVERHERRMQLSKQRRAKERVRLVERGRSLSGITLNEDGTWKRGTKKKTL